MFARFKPLAVSSAAGLALASVLLVLTAAHTAHAQSAGLVISQIYGGGGLSGSPYNRDFVELFNGTGSAINLSGYTLQTAFPTSNFSSNGVTTLTGTIASGGFFLIGGFIGTSGLPLPPVDVSGSFNLNGTNGKVALARDGNLVTNTGSGTFSSNVVDFVGYGPSANAYEGAAPAPSPSASGTTSIVRNSSPRNYLDSNNNGADFVAVPANSPGPRNSTSSNPFGANFVPSETPEPGTLPLLGMGLVTGAGSIGMVKRRKAFHAGVKEQGA